MANSATRALNEIMAEHHNPIELTNKAVQLHETKEHPSAE
jgi:hypothetical protein